jgi:hypothetical protein
MIVGPLHLRHACKQSAANNSVTDAITSFIHPQNRAWTGMDPNLPTNGGHMVLCESNVNASDRFRTSKKIRTFWGEIRKSSYEEYQRLVSGDTNW